MCRRFGLFGVRIGCSYRFIHSSCRRFYAAKGSWTTERSVSGYLAKGKRKAPLGLSVGGLFAYRHAPERLRSRTPWNKSSAYVSNTQSEFKRVVWRVLDRDAKRCACISQTPTIESFEVYSEILRLQTQ